MSTRPQQSKADSRIIIRTIERKGEHITIIEQKPKPQRVDGIEI